MGNITTFWVAYYVNGNITIGKFPLAEGSNPNSISQLFSDNNEREWTHTEGLTKFVGRAFGTKNGMIVKLKLAGCMVTITTTKLTIQQLETKSHFK